VNIEFDGGSMSLLELLLLHELLYLARLLEDSLMRELIASEFCLLFNLLSEFGVVLIVVCCWGDELREDEDDDERTC